MAEAPAKRVNQRMLRDFEIIELQADELCTFIGTKSRATWLVAAIAVCSRWAGSVLGRRASRNATAVRNDVILRGRVGGVPLLATDGFEYSVGVSERLFGSACVSGHVLKTRRNDRVVRVAPPLGRSLPSVCIPAGRLPGPHAGRTVKATERRDV